MVPLGHPEVKGVFFKEANEQRYTGYEKGTFWQSISGRILGSSRSKYLNSVDPREYGTIIFTVSEFLLCDIFNLKLCLCNLI